MEDELKKKIMDIVVKTQKERGIVDVSTYDDRIKSLEEKIMILENNDRYNYSDFNTRIKQLEASVSILLSKMK